MSEENYSIQLSDSDQLWSDCCKYLEWALSTPFNKSKVYYSFEGLAFCNITKYRILSIKELCLFLNIKLEVWESYQYKKELSKTVGLVQTAIYHQNDRNNPENLLNLDFALEIIKVENTKKDLEKVVNNLIKSMYQTDLIFETGEYPHEG